MSKAAYSPQLKKPAMRSVAKFAEENPGFSLEEIADKKKCSVSQVRTSIRKYKAGELEVRGSRRTNKKKVEKAMESEETLLYKEQYKYVLSQLSTDKELSAKERALALEKNERARKMNWETNVQSHLTGIDWEVYAETVRMFTNASNEEIVTIYREAKEICRLNKKDSLG